MSKDKKLNNLIDMKDYSEKEFAQPATTTKRTDVAKDIIRENTGKDVFGEKPKSHEEYTTSKGLNNLISLDNFSKNAPNMNSKSTKRTDVAKDVLESAYVLGKDVLHEKPKTHEDHTTSKGLNNLISLDDFTQKVPTTSAKSTKHTDVAKDILEKKKQKDEECDDDYEEEDDKPKKGLSAEQKKLPKHVQKMILKKQGN
jgi:hypothetical protein